MAGFMDTYKIYRRGACQHISTDAEYVGEGSIKMESVGVRPMDSEPVGAELIGTACKT